MRRDYLFKDHDVTFTILSDRDKTGPWGIFGGKDGRKAYYILNPEGEAKELSSKTTLDSTDCELHVNSRVFMSGSYLEVEDVSRPDHDDAGGFLEEG